MIALSPLAVFLDIAADDPRLRRPFGLGVDAAARRFVQCLRFVEAGNPQSYATFCPWHGIDAIANPGLNTAAGSTVVRAWRCLPTTEEGFVCGHRDAPLRSLSVTSSHLMSVALMPVQTVPAVGRSVSGTSRISAAT